MWESGRATRISATGEGSRSGLIIHVTKGIGAMTWPMEEANSSMQMGMCTKANGRTIRPMDLESTFTRTEPDMKGNGRRINSTAMGSKRGQMVLDIKEIM